MNRNQTPKVIVFTTPSAFVAKINHVKIPDNYVKVAMAEYFHDSSYFEKSRRSAVLTLKT